MTPKYLLIIHRSIGTTDLKNHLVTSHNLTLSRATAIIKQYGENYPNLQITLTKEN